MKKLFVLSTLLLTFIYFGCQENLVTPESMNVSTDLVSSNSTIDKNLPPPGTIIKKGAIKLSGLLKDPSQPFNSMLWIEGKIRYEHRLIIIDPFSPAPQYYITIQIWIDAEIWDPDFEKGPRWKVTGSCAKTFPGGTSTELHNYNTCFNVEGRNLDFICNFIVNKDCIELNTFELKLNKIYSSNIVGY